MRRTMAVVVLVFEIGCGGGSGPAGIGEAGVEGGTGGVVAGDASGGVGPSIDGAVVLPDSAISSDGPAPTGTDSSSGGADGGALDTGTFADATWSDDVLPSDAPTPFLPDAMATPDVPPIDTGAITADASSPADASDASVVDGASTPDSSDAGVPTCGIAGQGCSAGCCAGNTCVNFPDLGGAFCAATCTSGADCASGCCTPLQNGGNTCAPASYCPVCKKAGVEGCQQDSDCCSGSACIAELNGQGQTTRTLCKDYCTANTDCFSGCCAGVQAQTYRVCSAPNFCPTPAPPPTATIAPGTYNVTVSREDQDLYRVVNTKTWIKTQFCYQYVYFDAAALVWNGKFASGNRITFSSGQGCDVVDILVGQ